jgi:threonine dehydrogenase-like Zn-dependent dehydrogenase
MDVIVRVTTTAIGPRDLARYAGHDPTPGTIPGGEFCGLVDEVGAGISTVDLRRSRDRDRRVRFQ